MKKATKASPQSKAEYQREEAKEKVLIKKGDLKTLAKMHKGK